MTPHQIAIITVCFMALLMGLMFTIAFTVLYGKKLDIMEKLLNILVGAHKERNLLQDACPHKNQNTLMERTWCTDCGKEITCHHTNTSPRFGKSDICNDCGEEL